MAKKFNQGNLIISIAASVLTISAFTCMVVVTGQNISDTSRYSGWALWGLAWFPLILVATLSIVVELKDRTPLVQRIIFLLLPYAFLTGNALLQKKSLVLLITQAGLMEGAGLLGAYCMAVVWLFLSKKESISEFLIPQLFGIVFGLILLYMVGKVLWDVHFISTNDLFLLSLSIVVRAWSLRKAIQEQIAPSKTSKSI